MRPQPMRQDGPFRRLRRDLENPVRVPPRPFPGLRRMKQENPRMSAARTNSAEWMAPEIAHVMYQRALAVGILFGAVSLGLATFPYTRGQFFHSYLLGFMFWLGITLGSMVFLMIQHLTGGAWGMVIRRPLEASMRVLPLMAFLVILVIVGIPH